ncbi:MAG: hypothetical protein IJF19_00370 [Clostridia bacterium]|nr:hypothetical protein [Clostridia bacterium]
MFKKIITLALAIVCLASVALVGVSALAPEKAGEVVYTATLTTPKAIEDVQGYVTYDANVLKVVDVAYDALGDAAIVNTEEAGAVYFNASVVKGLDFTAAKALIEIKFEVIGEGEVAAAITVEEMTEKDGDSYYTESNKVNEAVVLEEAIVEYVEPTTQATTPAATTEATTAATTAAPVVTTAVATDATSGTEAPVDSDVPPTGSNVAIFAVLAVVAMAGVAVVVLRKKANA